MNKRDVFKRGFSTGYDIAKQNEDDAIKSWVNWAFNGVVDSNTLDLCEGDTIIEAIVHLASVTESEHYRQFSPFEFFANDINESHDPEGLWAAYDDGVHKGATARAKEALRAFIEQCSPARRRKS